jgi:hypothetical protein
MFFVALHLDSETEWRGVCGDGPDQIQTMVVVSVH